MTTKVKKWGNSYAIRIPKKMMEQIGLSEDMEFNLVQKNGILEIQPMKPRKKTYTFDELVDQIKPGYEPEIVDWGPDVGAEILEPWDTK